MLTIFVLDVPEFRPVVDAARNNPACTVTGETKGYWRIDADTEITFDRKAMQLKPAIWYGAFTGGLKGEIVTFEQNTVRLAPMQSS